MNVNWHRPTCLLSFTCTDCYSKTKDMRLVVEKRCNRKIINVLSSLIFRSCENQAKVGIVLSRSIELSPLFNK
ncbi:hypothetical protein COJ18_27995 [Bacillus cereus]|nr:hypothetical protein CT694_29905 [Bacillus wiedmannii bv. thuringiensis]PFK30498.1 hypothetical protein COJ18_27995 [Bacillus cereus]